VHTAEQIFDLVNLDVCRFGDLRRASEVIHNGNRQNLQRHHLLDVLLSAFVLIGYLELSHSIIIFICQFPPITTLLADNSDVIFLESITE